MAKRKAAEMENEMDDQREENEMAKRKMEENQNETADQPGEKESADQPEVIQFGERVSDLISKIRNIPDSAKVKEVFLWELLCNATRAVCQIRLESLVDENIHGPPEPEFFIHIIPDKKNGSLTIIDSGIGMDNDELKSYLCNIPEHALGKYLQTIDKYDTTPCDVDLSYLYSDGWEFSLGFHSAYMVADRVMVTTKKTRGNQYVWESDGCKSYTIARDTSGTETLGRGGTKVTLFLNNNHLKYLEEPILNDVIKQYVDRLTYPIHILVDDQNTKKLKEIVDDEKQKLEEPLPIETLRGNFEGLRKKFEKCLGSRVEKVVVSDRLFELTNNLSVDRKTFEINPRSPIMEELRQKADDDDEDLEELILEQFEDCILNIHAYDIAYGTSYVYKPELDNAMCRFPSAALFPSRSLV